MTSPARVVLSILHARGLETTEASVQQWLDDTTQYFRLNYGKAPPAEVLVRQLLRGSALLQLSLWTRFCRPLPDPTLQEEPCDQQSYRDG